MKLDRNRFNFLRATGTKFNEMLQKVNMILEGLVDAKPYTLDWDEILKDYDTKGIGDVCEFASNYAFGWHAKNGKLDNDTSKQAMYLDIIEGIVARRDNVH